MRPLGVERVLLVCVAMLAGLLLLAASAGAATLVIRRGTEPGDTAWVYPLIGGSVLALLLGAALVLVLLRGRRR